MDKSVGMERYSSLVAIYGPAHFERIWNSKVLVVSYESREMSNSFFFVRRLALGESDVRF